MTSNTRQVGYEAFWEQVGKGFPSLKGAPSTDYYFECERLLLREAFGDLRGCTLLKTDLWDEAKNTEVLRWAAAQGASPFGVDISRAIAGQASETLAGCSAGLVVGDLRELPFDEGSFDRVYSMGTVEHFDEYVQAVQEIYRVLRPGGLAIVGVPNRLDPFLRPLLVALLQCFDLYAYGAERSFTPRGIRRILERAGFETQRTSGILLMPGGLRMLDLWIHTRRPQLTRLTRPMIAPFAWLYRNVPGLRRHGYLVAIVVCKPVDRLERSSWA